MINVEQLLKPILAGLATRQRDILVRRFGLDGKEPMTLAELGSRYKVTRERIRQIETSLLAMVNEKIQTGPLAELVGYVAGYLEEQGGVRRTDLLFADVKKKFEGLSLASLTFLMEASKKFDAVREDGEYFEFWHKDRNAAKKATRFHERFYKALKENKKEVLGGKIANDVLVTLAKEEGLNDSIATNFISLSKKFGENVYGDFGLSEWAEIQPRTVRDQAYLVLRKSGKPTHFSEITKLINGSNLGKRVANVSTVHNELIKDQRFVLVGRGMYALSEHGYEAGTAKEVIGKILKQQGSLHPHEIIELVNQKRFFKKNTILLNLQNKKLFRRLPDGKYFISEA